MKNNINIIMAAAALVLLVLSGCATPPTPAVLLVEGLTTTVTVVSVDQANQKITLKMNDGSIKVYQIKGTVQNFDKIKAGDVLRATLIESLALGVRKTKDKAGISETEDVGVAPRNMKPGIIVSDTIEIDSKIQAVDLQKGSITIKTPDGSVNTYKIDVNNPDFKNIKAGDNITLLLTNTLVLDFEAPAGAGK